MTEKITDRTIAKEVAEATGELNRVLKLAQENGVRVDVKVHRMDGFVSMPIRYQVETNSFRQL